MRQDLAPAQDIYCCGSSDDLGEGKEATGKLRQRTTSKEKFIAQQKKSLFSPLTAPGRERACPSLMQRHRVSAKQGWCSSGETPREFQSLWSSRLDFRSKFSILGAALWETPITLFLVQPALGS